MYYWKEDQSSSANVSLPPHDDAFPISREETLGCDGQANPPITLSGDTHKQGKQDGHPISLCQT
jgi:hypothetical protein